MTAVDDAWQAALAAEQQAVFGYGLLGPYLDRADRPAARTDQAAHDALVRATTAQLTRAGQNPVAPLADYPTLYPVGSPAAARRLAVRLEQDCARAWRYLYAAAAAATGSTARDRRHDAQHALTASAVRATQWRRRAGDARSTVAFPGIG